MFCLDNSFVSILLEAAFFYFSSGLEWNSYISPYQVLWNEGLVSRVVAKAYLELLKELLSKVQQSNIQCADIWYTFLPSLQMTTGRWHDMAEKVWHGLWELPIIFSEVRCKVKLEKEGRSKDEIFSLLLLILCELKNERTRIWRGEKWLWTFLLLLQKNE